jgi:predicted anti-sigma-YlaC factor YlaD
MIRKLWHRRRFMREHEWTHAHLSDYLDGDLGEHDHARVEPHVGLCPECRRVLAGLRSTLAALMGLREDVPTDVAAGVIARLRGEA